MSFELSQEEGKFLIDIARNTVTTYLEKGEKSNRPKIRQRKCLSIAEFS